MPYKRSHRNAALAIYPNNHSSYQYSPGEVVRGKITRLEKLASPEATLTIALFGVAFAEIEVGNGRRKRRYWSVFNFFTNGQYRPQQLVHTGPVHVEDGGLEGFNWEFAIPIPETTGVSVDGWTHEESPSFVSMTPQDVARQQLPPSHQAFMMNGTIEYFLEAHLNYTSEGKTKHVDSLLAIPIKAASWPGHADADPDHKEKLFAVSAKSYSLLPTSEEKKLGFKKKTKSLFGTKSVPCLKLNVTVKMPQVIQLNHATPFPLTIAITRDRTETSEELKDVPFKVKITSIRIVAKEVCNIRAAARFLIVYEPMANQTKHKRNLGLENVFDALRVPLEIEVSDSAPAVNIGAKLNLRLKADGLYTGNTCLARMNPKLVSSFVSYNIAVTHEFKYTVAIEVGDYKEELVEWVDVVLLPEPVDATRVQQQPVPVVAEEDVAPPSFTEAMKECKITEQAGTAVAAEAPPTK